ncbi:MFS transporter [Phaeacidiphilus oryzae]|uniref:MFS transporter n=1 Tax=Phaeacidiphilus oryzae TaxID=348818 RepID=UPI000A84646F|nr:MFS transporter [Phaeacidiphilus oryzae]
MQRLPRTVWLLVLARAVNRLGAFSFSFLTVLATTGFGASAATAGCVSAGFGLATIPSRLAGGRLADRLGRRRTIVLGLVGCALAQLGIAAAGGLAWLAVFAVLLGLAFELYEPPSQAMIADAVPPAQRPRAFSLLSAALAAAGMAAGLIAAALGRWDLRLLFVVDAATCLLCALVVRLVLPADTPRTPDSGRLRPGPGPDRPPSAVPVAAWRDRALLAVLASGTGFAVLYTLVLTVLPLVVADRGMPPADAGLLFTVSALTTVAGQPLLRRGPLPALSGPRALALGFTLFALGLAGCAPAHSPAAFIAPTVAWSLGDLLLMGRLYAAAADLAPPGATGRYLAVFGTSWGVAAVVAPLAGTQLLQHLGAAALWTVAATAALLLAALQPLLARATARQRPPRPVPSPEADAVPNS